MLNANYWIAKADKPFDVISLEDIALFNKKICSCYSDNNAQYKLLYDLRTFGNKVSSSFIREKMESFFPGETEYYHRDAEISAGACSKGFLPYTQANVLTLAFKPLGDRYGWGGMAESVDCSGLVLEVYRCFGFHLARDTCGQCCMPVQ